MNGVKNAYGPKHYAGVNRSRSSVPSARGTTYIKTRAKRPSRFSTGSAPSIKPQKPRPKADSRALGNCRNLPASSLAAPFRIAIRLGVVSLLKHLDKSCQLWSYGDTS
jgi:hypothetical protein